MFDNITIFYKDARMYINSYNADEVIKLLKKRINKGVKTAQNYAFLASAYYYNGKNKTALRYALIAKKLDEDYYYADYIIVAIYIDEEKFAKGEKYLRSLLEKAPDDYYYKYFAAVLLYSISSGFNKVVKSYARKLISLNCDEPFFNLCKSYAYMSLSEYKNALKFLSASMVKSFCHYYGIQIACLSYIFRFFIISLFNCDWNLLGFLPHFFTLFGLIQDDKQFYTIASECYNSNPTKGLKYIEKAIKIKDKPVYQIIKADILYLLDREDEAIEICEKVLSEDPSYTQCYMLLSKFYYCLDNYEKTLKYSNLALLNNMMDEDLILRKIGSLVNLERYDQALDTIKKYEDYFEDSDVVYRDYYERVKDWDKWLLYINKTLLKDKNNDILAQKARCLGILRRYEEVEKVCAEIIDSDDKYSAGYYWLAAAQYEQKKYDEALKNIDKSILYDGNDYWDFIVKSNILNAMNRHKEADFAYNRAVELGFEED